MLTCAHSKVEVVSSYRTLNGSPQSALIESCIWGVVGVCVCVCVCVRERERERERERVLVFRKWDEV